MAVHHERRDRPTHKKEQRLRVAKSCERKRLRRKENIKPQCPNKNRQARREHNVNSRQSRIEDQQHDLLQSTVTQDIFYRKYILIIYVYVAKKRSN